MKFEVRALHGDAMVSVIIDAVSEREARQQAQQQRLKPVSVRRIAAAAGPLAGRRHDFSLLLFSQELLTLLEAGLSVFEALETLHEKEKRPFSRSVLASVLARLSEGKPLSTAFGEMPELFPALYTSIIRTAERTSNLPQSVSRYVEYQTRLDGVRAKIASASIYPMVLAVVGAAVMLFLLGYVVPRFAVVYQGTGRELPALSALLLAWGTWVGQHQAIALACFVGGGAGLGAAVRSLRRGGAFLRGCARLPGMRERIHAYQLARFYLTLGMLLEGGMPIVAAMELVKALLPPELRSAASRSTARIARGESLSSAMEQEALSTSVVSRMLRVGEQSGRMGEMMIRAAQVLDADITRWIDRFSRTFEPLMMAAIGVVVGAVVVLLYIPIFDLAGSLG
ncbi:type II secretion system F family protein (plasmid) [Ralstonia pseudosolanacearum]|uniref:Type II secretion system F family protein n=1 Tax=Ralstonia solanacearum TaxID=305 RepID=A0AA92K5L6_RALSL|nr:type II secretion system F family protein [Ralstonia pseudosolanacearum]QOK98997.1 type II secretion system F family protein [Ralstonia pseudosolanacearum]